MNLYQLPQPLLKHLVYRSLGNFRGLDKFITTGAQELAFLRVAGLLKPLGLNYTYLPHHGLTYHPWLICLSCGSYLELQSGIIDNFITHCAYCESYQPEKAERKLFWKWFKQWKSEDQIECMRVLTATNRNQQE